MSGENTDSNRLTRRNVLRKSAASVTGVGIAATATSASARMDPEMGDEAFEVAHAYFSKGAVREALATYATDALDAAVEEGVIEDAGPGALPVDRLHDSPGAWAEASEGTTVFAQERAGSPSPKIEVKTHLDDGRRFTVAVRPVEGTSSYAVTDDDVSTQQCGGLPCGGSQCVWSCIEGRCEGRVLYCCDCEDQCDWADRCGDPVSCSCSEVCTGC